jgi:hypothetical protein
VINHLRTLLLNVDGNNAPGALYPGEQYVPPAFRARALSPALTVIHRLLFGSNPDRALRNQRLQEYLTCVHTAGLEQFVRALDPRVTYWPFNNSLLEKRLRGATAQRLAGADDQALYFIGTRSATESANQIFFQWRLDVLTSTTVRLTIYSDVPGNSQTSIVDFTVSGNLSSPVRLPGTDLQVTFTPGVGTAWLLEVLAPPRQPLVAVAADLEQALGDVLTAALWPAGAPEPYHTFANLWNLHDQLPFRLAGLVLALGYRLHELPG